MAVAIAAGSRGGTIPRRRAAAIGHLIGELHDLQAGPQLLGDRRMVGQQPRGIGRSAGLQVGVLATLIGLALGVPAALCVVRFQFGFRAPLASLLLMPLIVPGVVLGTSMYVFHVELENGLDVDVIGTFYALVAGHVVIVIPWVVRLITASLAGVDRSTEEAAQNLGANAWVTF